MVDLAVQVDGKKLYLDPTVHSNALVQNWQFPSKDGNSLNVSWERYDAYHAAPQVNFTASMLTPSVLSTSLVFWPLIVLLCLFTLPF